MVKLLRTDTTLDLSQKARVVKIPECPRKAYIGSGKRTDHVMICLFDAPRLSGVSRIDVRDRLPDLDYLGSCLDC